MINAEIHRIVSMTEEWHLEGGRSPRNPATVGVVGAVITNPFMGEDFIEDLPTAAEPFVSELGTMLAERVGDLLGGHIEAYGKGALVGEGGEIEHGSALIHTLKFGNPLRDVAGGTVLVPSAEKRGPAGSTIDLALKHTTDASVRSHHWTVEFRVADAPHADQILVLCAGVTAGRPQARIGAGPQDDDV